jgi:two-component system OmpR family sensor kinase
MKNMPLRVKLVAALCLLVAVALAATGVVATRSLHSYLVGRVDNQLHDVAFGQPRGGGGGGGAPPGDFGDSPNAPDTDDTVHGAYYIQEIYANGTPKATPRTTQYSAGATAPQVPHWTPTQVSEHGSAPFTVPSQTGGHSWRVVAVPDRQDRDNPGGSVMFALSLADVDSTVHRLIALEVIIGVVGLVLLGGLGYVLVRNSLRPLIEVETTAGAIAAGDLTRRVPDLSPRTEVGRLSRALNAMLGQIESAFTAQRASETAARASEERMRRFVADASHELRTPLTSIRGFAELYRQGAVKDESAIRRAMRRIEDEAARMGLLVEDLLMLARLDEQRPLEQTPVDVLAIATDAVHDARAVSTDHPIELEVLPHSTAPVVIGDDARLRQVVANLVNNAVIHTPPGTAVTVGVGTVDDDDGRWVLLEVADAGPGLKPGDAERVFERFYRADPSRTRTSGGSGLGLSIVAALVAAHNGTVTVDTQPGVGTTFRVRLPHVSGAGDEIDKERPALVRDGIAPAG